MRHDSEEYLQHLDDAIRELGSSGFQQEITDGFRSNPAYDLIYHTWNSRNSPAGYPDTMIPVPPALWYLEEMPPLLAIEAKVGKNKPKIEQIRWLKALRVCGCWTFVLWPRHRPVLHDLYSANFHTQRVQDRLHVYTKRGERQR